ncbi:zinc-dependent metalloprotease [soil metagenome]
MKPFLPVALALLISGAHLPAQTPEPSPGPEKTEEKDKDKDKESEEKKTTPPAAPAKKKTMAEALKNCDETKGLFTFHRNRENGTVYLFIDKKQLDREFIYFSHTVDGVVASGRNRGQFHDDSVIKIQRNYERLEIVKQNTAFYFDPEHPLAKAAEANLSHAVLASEPIVAENEEGMLVSAGSLFLKENLMQVKPSVGSDGKSLLGKLSDTKTKFVQMKSFAQHTLFTVEYVYENTAPPRQDEADREIGDVTDSRYISVIIQHSLIEMPKNDYQPRSDDPRVGYFMTELTDQTSTEVTPYRDFIHRWNLQKKDPAAALSEPVEPIVWWIENTTPLEFRDTIREAALKWNRSFEKIGFKNAMVIKDQPDNADWDADDIQHNVLRWTSSPKPPFGGYGPSFINPRTGQILGSDIMLEFSFIKNRLIARRIWSEVGLAGAADQPEAAERDCRECMAANVMQQGLMLGNQMLRLRKADQIDFDIMLKEALSQLVLHELGHTLGLNHNFRGSQLHSPQELQDRVLTEKTGLSGSVMDYMPMNLGPDKAHQGQYFINAPGSYDDWAIDYGYSVALPDAAAESTRLVAIASRSNETALAFANDADDMRVPGKSIDPRAMIYDMSSDPIAYGSARCELVQQAMSKLLKEYPVPGKSWQELTQAYVSLSSESSNALTAISRYVGGVYVERAFVNQVKDNAPLPLRPVEADKQKAAMQALTKYAFGPGAWQTPEALLSHLQQQRRGFDFKDTGEDPKIHERILKLQRALLDHLLHVHTQNRILDSALYGNGYALSAMMHDLTQSIMTGEAEGATLSTVRQNLQLEYVERLLGVVKNKGYQSAAQSVALFELKMLEKKLKEVPGVVVDANQPHMTHLLYTIEQGLDEKKS